MGVSPTGITITAAATGGSCSQRAGSAFRHDTAAAGRMRGVWWCELASEGHNHGEGFYWRTRAADWKTREKVKVRCMSSAISVRSIGVSCCLQCSDLR